MTGHVRCGCPDHVPARSAKGVLGGRGLVEVAVEGGCDGVHHGCGEAAIEMQLRSQHCRGRRKLMKLLVSVRCPPLVVRLKAKPVIEPSVGTASKPASSCSAMSSLAARPESVP